MKQYFLLKTDMQIVVLNYQLIKELEETPFSIENTELKKIKAVQ